MVRSVVGACVPSATKASRHDTGTRAGAEGETTTMGGPHVESAVLRVLTRRDDVLGRAAPRFSPNSRQAWSGAETHQTRWRRQGGRLRRRRARGWSGRGSGSRVGGMAGDGGAVAARDDGLDGLLEAGVGVVGVMAGTSGSGGGEAG